LGEGFETVGSFAHDLPIGTVAEDKKYALADHVVIVDD
jgi:hypothetical protein